MTTMTTAAFTAARVQGRYRVLDEAGQIVVTLNSKAKAEARAAELNAAATTVAEADTMAEIDAALAVLDVTPEADAAEDELLAQVEADVAMEQAMDAECPQEETAEQAVARIEVEHTERMERLAQIDAEESDAAIIARQDAEEAQVLAEEEAMQRYMAAEERQEEPAADAGTSDTPAQEEKPQGAAQPVAEKPAKTPPAHHGKAQPAPHAFTTVGTTIKNHCAECGRTWAAAAHRKFREAQTETVEEVTAGTAEETEGEWTPAADDTTPDGKAPGETDADAS
jgi:hypothetical protein